MIKALFLIFLPVPTWEQILALQRKPAVVFALHLLPLLLLVAVAEGFGLVTWGTARGNVSQLTRFTVSQAVVFETGRVLLNLVIVFSMVKMIKALGETFHGRHSFQQVFTVTAYGLSPLFLLQIFNAFPSISPWMTWSVGLALCMAVLYHGLPIIMKPDPPHAFGLYFMTILLLLITSGLVCFLTAWYLKGKFVKLDQIIAEIASRLPF